MKEKLKQKKDYIKHMESKSREELEKNHRRNCGIVMLVFVAVTFGAFAFHEISADP